MRVEPYRLSLRPHAVGGVSRTEDRKEFPEAVRIRLLEADMDDVAEGLASVRKLLQSILVSTATASILLAINLLTGGL